MPVNQMDVTLRIAAKPVVVMRLPVESEIVFSRKSSRSSMENAGPPLFQGVTIQLRGKAVCIGFAVGVPGYGGGSV